MKKFLLCAMLSLISVFTMAIGRNDGSTKANAIEFDLEGKGVDHPGGTLWYRVDLAPLYKEDNPSMTLYLTNPSNVVGSSVDVSMKATVAGQEESKEYTIAARQYKTYTANAKTLVTLKQKEIYLTLTSNGLIKLSAKVFETEDLDETCKDARNLAWGVTAVQDPMYSAWWKVSLTPIKNEEGYDAQVTITNTGSKTVNLKIGQSLDCPSSGMTKREYTLAAGESVVKKVPRDMITSVQPNELYFGVENVESQVSMLVEKVAQPPIPIIPASNLLPGENLHVTDTIESLPEGTTLYKISVADMDSLTKYEPEFTYRNVGTSPAKVTIQMAFSRPAFSTSDTEYDLAEGAEEIVVYKKNMLEGMDGVDSIYLLTTVTGKVNFYGRFKHVREGKACKTNIDFNWETGHTQEARTTQWYAIDVTEAKDNIKDIIVYLQNQGTATATVNASMAFDCPYIDLQEATRTIAAKSAPVTRRLGYSTYAMLSDTIWIGLETNQDIKFWATMENAETKEADEACLHAEPFDWDKGVKQNANDTIWYKIDMREVREKSAKFPTVFIQNLSSTAAAKIVAEMSLECPDSIANQADSLTIKANDSYSRKIARTMFENISVDSLLYLRVISTQDISLQIRLNEEAEGTSCNSAIPFNDISGNSQAANSNLWYKVDLTKAMKDTLDLNLIIENKDAAVCEGVGQLTFGCPDEEAPSVQSFTLGKKEKKTLFRPHSAFQLLPKGDSAVYINLQGNTAMHISVEYVTPAAFTPITGPSTSLDTLLLDSKDAITQNAAVQWYIIPKEEIQHMRDTIKVVPLTPNIHLENSDLSNDYDVTIEAAFAFPINETMISQKVTVAAGQAFVHALDYKLFNQAINKFDSVLVRITIPAAATGKVRIKSGVDKAFNGNTRETASPILVGEEYIQDGNTTMWYKLKTADLKKDMSLINKSLNVRTSNKGNAATTIKVAIYEGLQAKEDMFEKFGLDNYRERTIKKGEDRNRDFPFQNILMLGDVELYIQVTTTQKITFSTKISGEYAPVAEIDTMQFKATLLVPNVDYVIPGDNENHWYQICIPYIRNNYKYTHASSLTYVFEKKATMEVLNTYMDTMKYKFPSRKRTVNKDNKHYVDTKPLSELLSKGLQKVADQTIDITTFEENFIDSMIRRYMTGDSITMYIRYKTDADMKVRLNMPKVKGDSCLNPVIFDWEHGFVNAAREINWIQVKLESTKIPEDKDLMIHMDNWTGDSTEVEATLYVANCKTEDKLGTIKRKIFNDTTKVLERQFLQEELGWTDLMFEYYSDSTTHIWAELIDPYKRDSDTLVLDTVYVCPMETYTSKYDDYAAHIIDPKDPSSWTWTVAYDSINRQEGKITTFMIIFNVQPKQAPKLYDIADLTIPTIKKGEVIDASAATTEIFKALNKAHKDSIQAVISQNDSIMWEYCINGYDFEEVDGMSPLPHTAVALRYYVVTECDDTIYSNLYINVPTDTIDSAACGPVTWYGKIYNKIGLDTLVNETIHVAAGAVLLDSIAYMHLTITPDVLPKEVVDTCITTYTWLFNNKTYTATATATDYTDTIIDPVSGCYKIGSLSLKYTPDVLPTVTVDTCVTTYYWTFNQKTYTATTTATEYTDTIVDPVSGCNQVCTLNLKYTPDVLPTVTVDTCSQTYYWAFNQKTYTATATATEYTDTIVDPVSGCDQICTLNLKFTPNVLPTETVDTCQAYTWAFNGKTYTEAGTYTDTLLVGACSTVGTLVLSLDTVKITETADSICNDFYWYVTGETYHKDTTVNYTIKHAGECDTIMTLKLTHVMNPTRVSLRLVPKYGDRLLMIDRKEVNSIDGWNLDVEADQDLVKWYRIEANGDTTFLKTGYYLTNPDGSQNGKYIQPGRTYFAKIEIPIVGKNCGLKAETNSYKVGNAAAAPALMPSLARPGENIHVINLNPEETTTIRVYTSEGLVQSTYTVNGEESFDIEAAKDHGFYLVELRSESNQSTLRYIVK